jgi:hypothetical protein
MTEPLFTKFVSEARSHGIFTLAAGWTLANKKQQTPGDESIEAYIEKELPGQLQMAEQEVGRSKVRRGRWVAEHNACPPSVNQIYGTVLDRFGISTKLPTIPMPRSEKRNTTADLLAENSEPDVRG